MTISNVSSYISVYESLYASKQTKTSEKTELSADGTSKTNSASQTTEEYLSYLRQKYSDVNITVTDLNSDKQMKNYMFGCSGGNNIAISSSILEKMASDPATAAKYEQYIADVPKAAEEIKEGLANYGAEMLACGTVIDRNGKVSYWCIGKYDEVIENPGTVYKEKIQKQLEEKRAKNKEEEALKAKKQEEAERQEKLQEKKVYTAESKEGLLEKIKTAKEDEPSTAVRIKEEGKGGQIDLSI